MAESEKQNSEQLIAAFEGRYAKELDSARGQHGELVILTASGEVAALRRPSRAEYQRFKKHRVDERYRTTALERMVEQCMLLPAPADFEKVLAKKPVLADSFGEKLLQECGMEEAEAKNS